MYSELTDMFFSNEWDLEFTKSNNFIMYKEGIMEIIKNDPAYVAFYERFPDAKEDDLKIDDYRHELTVGIENFETESILTLKFYVMVDSGTLEKNISCFQRYDDGYGGYDNKHGATSGAFVIDFINRTDCMG